MFYNMFEMFEIAIKNDGIISIEKESSCKNNYEAFYEDLEMVFKYNLENSDFFASKLFYTKSNNPKTPKKKKCMDSILVSQNDSHYQISLYKLFELKEEDSNLKTLNSFVDFFLMLKKQVFKDYYFKTVFLLEKSPTRFEVNCRSKIDGKMIDNPEMITKVENYIMQNKALKDWLHMISYDLSYVGPYSWLTISKGSLLTEEEKYKQYQIQIKSKG